MTLSYSQQPPENSFRANIGANIGANMRSWAEHSSQYYGRKNIKIRVVNCFETAEHYYARNELKNFICNPRE